ncbi:MAG: hypothetical protein J6Z03_00820 [Erysipelotrichaceae bacterium]|nr:hypothetical protein [Erysipelotrichaceae bacterium]
MKQVDKPAEEVILLFVYDVDNERHIIYSLGVDESGNYYSVEEHEYNIGSAYSFYTDYYILEENEIEEISKKAIERKNSPEHHC